MGLDNGIHIKRKDGGAINIAKDYGWYEFVYEDSVPNYEVCYFRKFWSLRDQIVRYLNGIYGTNSDTYEWDLSLRDIKAIKRIIKGMIVDTIKGDAKASTIWETEIEIAQMGDALKNLLFLEELLEDEGEDNFVVYFYDSY